MKRLLVIILFIALKSQSQNVLWFSDEIENGLYNIIKKNSNDKYKEYVRLSHLSEDTIQLNIEHYDFADTTSTWTKLINSVSTRIRIKDKQIPLLSSDDFQFSLFVRHYDPRDSLTYFDIIPRGGYYILFEQYHPEKIIRTGYEQ